MEFNYNCGFNIDQTNFYWYQKGFSDEEMLWIDNLKNLYPLDFDQEVNKELPEKKFLIRIRKIAFQDKNNNRDDRSLWLYDKLKGLSFEANNSIWGFDIHSIIEPIKHFEYFEGANLNWHLDIGLNKSHRKITIIAQLSDPEEYEGGDFELWTGQDFKILPKNKGCIILFPSFLLYRMTPVTKGTKKALELFICGDSFK